MTDKRLFSTGAELARGTARLNDLARAARKTVNAAWLAMSGVAALIAEAGKGHDRGIELASALAGISKFNEGDDPYGERDFGAIKLWV